MGNVGGVGGAQGSQETQLPEGIVSDLQATGINTPVFARGFEGGPVTDIQKALNAAKLPGLKPIAEDGVFGRETERAVAAFQKKQGLPATGIVDTLTMLDLEALNPGSPAAATGGAQGAAGAQGAGKPAGSDTAIPKDRLVESFKGKGPDEFVGEKLVATIGGKERVLDEGPVGDAWKLGDGRYLAWDGGQGSGIGGFENEGEGLKLYDAKTGDVRTVMLEGVMIDNVKLEKLPNGKDALLVTMSDGGLGANHLAIVDPERGQVASFNQATAGKVTDGKLIVEHRDYEAMNEGGDAKVTKREEVDLAKLLEGPVIVNPRDNLWDSESVTGFIRDDLSKKNDLSLASTLKGISAEVSGVSGIMSSDEAAQLLNTTVLGLAEDGGLEDLVRMVESGKLPGGVGPEFTSLLLKHGNDATKQAWNRACVAANR